jgi:hypothetical protein
LPAFLNYRSPQERQADKEDMSHAFAHCRLLDFPSVEHFDYDEKKRAMWDTGA